MAKDTKKQFHGVGRRKTAVVRVFLKDGSGKIVVNGKELLEYFNNSDSYVERIMDPLVRTNNADKFDVLINACGGGIKGQAEAAKLAIARALLEVDAGHRHILKPLGMLTFDSRQVERKHYYKRKARKSPQFSKR